MSIPGRSKVSARQALRDRCLTVAGGRDASAVVRHLDAAHGGIVFSSTKSIANKTYGIGSGNAIRRSFPGLVVAADLCENEEYPATAQEPVALPDFGGTLLEELDPLSVVEQHLQSQFAAGTDIGVIPGRVVPAEDSDALAALIDLSNRVRRADVIVRVPVHYPWLREPDSVGQLIAIISKSRHPVALSVSHEQDPMKVEGVPAGFRKVVDALPRLVIPWKTDLAGIDAFARGAMATSVGVIPGLRHSRPPKARGRRIDRDDKTPRVFVPQLLRYVRVSYMRDQWFASTDPLTCDCRACAGRPLTRFTGAAADLREAAAHNAAGITALHRHLASVPRQHRPVLWREKLQEAEIEHEAFSTRIEQKVPFHPVLRFWLENA